MKHWVCESTKGAKAGWRLIAAATIAGSPAPAGSARYGARLIVVLPCAVALITMSSLLWAAGASEASPSLRTSALTWTPLGPSNIGGVGSGKVAAVAVDWANRNIIYVASGNWAIQQPEVSGDPSGVYVTTDGGVHWTQADSGLADVQVISLWVDQNNPNLVLAATPSGLYVTTDGASSWADVPTFSSMYVIGIVNVGSTIYVATPTAVYSSTDLAGTWSLVWSSPVVPEPGSGGGPFGNSGEVAVQVRPPSPGIMTLAVNAAEACAATGGVLPGSIGSGPWLACGTPTTTWKATNLASSCPSQSGQFACSIDQLYLGLASPSTLFAWFDQENGNVPPALFRSLDNGSTWAAVSVPPTTWSGLQSLALDPNNPNVVWAAQVDSPLYESTDLAGTWQSVGGSGDIRCILPMPGDPGVIYLGTDQGLYESTAGPAGPWVNISGGVTDAMLASVSASGSDILTVEQDYGVVESVDGGGHWMDTAGEEEGVALINPADPQFQYTSTFDPGGQPTFRVSSDGGQSWQAASPQDVGALAVAPSAPNDVYATGGKLPVATPDLFKSTDWGKTWQTVGPLPSASGQNSWATAVAVDPSHPDRLLVAVLPIGGQGRLYGSSDGGGTWSPIDNPCNSPAYGEPITSISWEGANPSLVLLGAAAYFDTSSNVCVSVDGGSSFVSDGQGLPAPLSYVASDTVSLLPGAQGGAALVAVPGVGIFESSAPGSAWTPLQGSFASNFVSAIAWSDGHALLGTWGEGVIESSASLGAASPPAAPVCGSPAVSGSTATITWSAPASTGGAPLSGYVVTAINDGVPATPAWLSASATSTSFDISDARSHGATVVAVNAAGASSACSVSTGPPPPQSGPGYWMLDSAGQVFAFGSAGSHGSPGSAIGMSAGVAATPDGKGYFVVGTSGQVAAFGDAATYPLSGSPSGPVVTIASTTEGKGYWVATTSGQVLTAGDGVDYGSPAEQDLHLNGGIVNMVPTADGKGYWMLGSDGGVFAYGDAAFYGSTGDMRLNAPAVAMYPTRDDKGYWFVASDGGILSFGDASFYGSMGGVALNKPVNGMVATSDDKGYWLVASDGGVFAFGDAGFVGSLGGNPPASPVVGFAAS